MLSTLRNNVSVTGRQVVSAATPLSSAAGIWAYAQGGNAFDAALAACFVDTIALPMKCGLAGDLVALFHEADQPWQALLSVGGAPRAVDRGEPLAVLGPRAVGVPGAPAGYAALAQRCRLPLQTLIQPAVSAAEQGVVWTPSNLRYLAGARELLMQWSPACVYARHFGAKPGDVLKLPGLGRLLQRFATLGAALFHDEEGRRLADAVQQLGGVIAHEDLRAHQPIFTAPAQVELPGFGVLMATPEPTQGALLLEVISRLLSAHPGQLSTAADPDAVRDDTVLASLVAGVRAEARQRGREARDDGTSVVMACDAWGNQVTVVHSNSFPRFGAGIVLDDGLVLNNRPGRGFDPQAPKGAPNAAAGGKMPPTTLHAWGLLQAGRVTLGATPGGVNQLPWNSQSVRDLLQGLSPAEIVTQPRWAVGNDGAYSAELGVVLDDETFHARQVERFSFLSVQQIIRQTEDGLFEACADPRAGGRALALY
ncbi:MAG: gamma-glutamyltransferase family protein [Pigmentiphaga sp.]|nr:gamma-glutamyltransferase family protein [Pigmentiphaga sp.]